MTVVSRQKYGTMFYHEIMVLNARRRVGHQPMQKNWMKKNNTHFICSTVPLVMKRWNESCDVRGDMSVHGSTHGVHINGSDVFVVHVKIKESYKHMILVIRDEKVRCMNDFPLPIHHRSFVMSFNVHDDNVLFTYGVNDRSCFTSTASLGRFFSSLC